MILWLVKVEVLMGLSPFSSLLSLALLLAAEYEVPHMSDPPAIKLMTLASAEVE
jgi:hypothetical protein